MVIMPLSVNSIKITQRSLIIFFIFILSAVFCDASSGIAIDKTSVAFDMTEGEQQQFIIEVQNISSHAREIHINVVDYSVGDNNEIILLDESNGETGVRDWITFENENFNLRPREKKEILFTVRTPKNAYIGSHHGAVFFGFEANNDENASISTSGQVGVHTLINVKGDVHAAGKINSFDIPLFALGTITYTTEFENLGNIHYVPHGELTVQNVFTKKTTVYKYDKHFVFPNTKFIFSINEKVPSIFGLYRARIIFIDGEGIARVGFDYTMGYLFPLVFLIALTSIILLLRFLKKNNKQKI